MPTAQERLDELGVDIPEEKRASVLELLEFPGVAEFPTHVLTEMVKAMELEVLHALMRHFMVPRRGALLTLSAGEYIIEFDNDGVAHMHLLGDSIEQRTQYLLMTLVQSDTTVRITWILRTD